MVARLVSALAEQAIALLLLRVLLLDAVQQHLKLGRVVVGHAALAQGKLELADGGLQITFRIESLGAIALAARERLDAGPSQRWRSQVR